MADLLGRVRTDKQLQDRWQVGLFLAGAGLILQGWRVARASLGAHLMTKAPPDCPAAVIFNKRSGLA